MSSVIGKEIRKSRILNPATGKAIVVAMDHGLFMGPVKGLERVAEAVKGVAEGQPDALQVNPGTAIALHKHFCGKGAPALVLRVDASNLWRSKPVPKEGYHAQVATVEDAVKLGADAVVCFLFAGYPSDLDEANNLEFVGSLARHCREFGIPLIVEPLGIQKGGGVVRDPEIVKLIVRMGAEAGADLIKADYTGEQRSFAEVVEISTAPILVRGGPKMETARESLQMVKDAIEVGAAGIVFGRNIWQHENPAAMVRALAAVIHEGATVEEAMKKSGAVAV